MAGSNLAARRVARPLNYSTKVPVRQSVAECSAIIAAGMASLDEVMLPWLQVERDGGALTLYQNYKWQEAAALEAGT